MTYTDLRNIAEIKTSRYTAAQCESAIADCHDTLKVGGYAYEHPYAKQLWAEIDACRDRARFLSLLDPAFFSCAS